MTDVHNKATRSYNMSRIRGGNTKPEMLVRRFLHAEGFRYLLHDKRLPGKPDLVFPKYQMVIQVHGCFWHGHEGCRYFVLPETRKEWWKDKIQRTKENDIRTKHTLRKMGWRVIEIWECDLRPGKMSHTLNELKINILNGLQK